MLRFDGLNDRLAIRNLNYSSSLAGVTVCAMVRSDTAAEQIILNYDQAHYWELALSDGGDPALAQWRTTDTTTKTDNLASPRSLVDPRTDTHWHAVCAVFDAGATPDKRLFVNGAPVSEATTHGGNSLGSSGETRFGFVGAASQADAFDGDVAATGFFAGDLVEIVLYNRALSDAERDQLETYFAKRYG